MTVHISDAVRMTALQAGQFFEAAGVVGFAFSYDLSDDAGVACVQLSGQSPFGIVKPDYEVWCNRTAMRGQVERVFDSKPVGPCAVAAGSVLVDTDERAYLAVTMPPSASFIPATETPSLAYISLDEWSLVLTPPKADRVVNRWWLKRGKRILFPRQ